MFAAHQVQPLVDHGRLPGVLGQRDRKPVRTGLQNEDRTKQFQCLSPPFHRAFHRAFHCAFPCAFTAFQRRLAGCEC